ncbi:EAL domain-containing protein [Paenibacillus sp. P26]|nr:EAL domain-containing protein [Paenibacillus sp. P26]UUZ93116.1 EAL domain-containing protein [Paenibacillus sp. P25]
MVNLQCPLQFLFSPAIRNGDEVLFINLFPSTIVADHFLPFMDTLKQEFLPFRHRIVLEINESVNEGRVWNHPLFIPRIRDLREEGFFIALDDVGEGTTTLRKIVEISPDFIKIDRFFSKDLSGCTKKQKVIRLLVEYCQDTSGLILEGIEREEDFLQALRLGVKVGQGFFLGKPERL